MIEALLIAGIGGIIGCLARVAVEWFHYQHAKLSDVFLAGVRISNYTGGSGGRHDLRALHGDCRRHSAGDSCGAEAYFCCATRAVSYLDFHVCVR